MESVFIEDNWESNRKLEMTFNEEGVKIKKEGTELDSVEVELGKEETERFFRLLDKGNESLGGVPPLFKSKNDTGYDMYVRKQDNHVEVFLRFMGEVLTSVQFNISDYQGLKM